MSVPVALHSILFGPPALCASVMRLLGSIILLTLGLLGGALAQDSAQGSQQSRSPDQAPLESQIKGAAGRDIRVLVLTNVRPDCTSGPLPTVRLVGAPANGKISVRRVRLNATNLKQCLSLEIPALVAFYRSAPEFEGNDSVTVEIRPDEGAPEMRRIIINVTKADLGRSI
jgi:hypothetical protein